MQGKIKKGLLLLAVLLPMVSFAQLSSNPDKFLGNITTRSNVDAGNGVPNYYLLWNQITCENESKWGSVEGNRGVFNWGCDRAFNYAQQHGFTYKFHALVWGAQYPNWLPNLTPKERFNAITNWFDNVKAKYNTLRQFHDERVSGWRRKDWLRLAHQGLRHGRSALARCHSDLQRL